MSCDERIPAKRSLTSLRLVTFNVNGVKTLKNYYPWTLVSEYGQMLDMMKGDIVTFQELKLQRSDVDLKIADIPGYSSFISVPLSKKGYSGVGVFVRKPRQDEPDLIKRALTVIRVEEGITGILPHKKKTLSYREAYEDPTLRETCIGGYPSHKNVYDKLRKVDGEGRCVIVELNFNVVVISVYCPANSLATEEGEEFRMLFLGCLFERAQNLREMGKHVVIMGDINVCVDLIDSDDTIKTAFRERKLVKAQESHDFESLNVEQVLAFKNSAPHRTLVNNYVVDSSGFGAVRDSQFLHDVVREKQGRRLKMYTVWSTFKSNRPLNIGSRIDLILASEKLACVANQADIWPFLHGSDHCPTFTDYEYAGSELVKANDRSLEYAAKPNWFEATNFYGLHTRGSIDKFFKKRERPLPQEQAEPTQAIDYATRKKQKVEPHEQLSISDFFFKSSYDAPEEHEQPKPRISVANFKEMLKDSSSSAPLCKHGEPCSLRTVKAEKNRGKKFWCCARSTLTESWATDQEQKQEKDVDAYNCGFFKWASRSWDKKQEQRRKDEQLKQKLRELKQEKEAEKKARVDKIKEKRARKEEKERYERMASIMHAKKVDRCRVWGLPAMRPLTEARIELSEARVMDSWIPIPHCESSPLVRYTYVAALVLEPDPTACSAYFCSSISRPTTFDTAFTNDEIGPLPVPSTVTSLPLYVTCTSIVVTNSDCFWIE
ncbi:hypothetical protein OGAPHI_000080 [Ogataea philodendri]|uniref:DNA-(apurinic or apyrimidinic site) endonuclease 2 n=1 Tax=Ogataea philodendri TaxID=1378263 RepID=A0A9P8PII4_9ASCO|nr:uncharacterized protein OGAPHI_000080 [Ogataea philodendri]KAH3671894.1 hypothetical protein OGAPHI_000080 [Ogataea philodendri]